MWLKWLRDLENLSPTLPFIYLVQLHNFYIITHYKHVLNLYTRDRYFS